MIRVQVVHQDRLIANIIASVMSEEPDIRIVGTATKSDEVLTRLQVTDADIILVAATLPDSGALHLTQSVVERYPECKVLVIGLPKSESVILQYVMAGATGYVLQDVPVERLLDNVRAAHKDEALVSPTMAAALMNQVAELARISTQYNIDPRAISDLTPRERDVLDLIAEELTNQQIADRLVIEVGTVKNHVHNILKKLDVGSREEAASYLAVLGEEESDAELT